MARIKDAANASLAELAAENNAELNRLQNQQSSLSARYKAEERIEITISPMYAPHFGNVMPIILNGIAVYVPCNGQPYAIPYSFAMEARQRIAQVDEQLRRNKKLSDVASNAERFAGELDLMSPRR